jgi:hypothetical protein
MEGEAPGKSPEAAFFAACSCWNTVVSSRW